MTLFIVEIGVVFLSCFKTVACGMLTTTYTYRYNETDAIFGDLFTEIAVANWPSIVLVDYLLF